MNKRCRRSERAHNKTVRYRSEEENTIPIQDGKTSDNNFLLHEPSSSSSESMIKSKHRIIDDTLKEILIQIGLYDELYTIFKSRGITAQALKYMQIRHIDELFKGIGLNTKIIFEHRLKEWQEKSENCKENVAHEVNKEKVKQSQGHSSIHQVLRENDITNLSNLLTNAVQQTINRVLQDFKQTCQIQSSTDKNHNYNNEVPSEIISLQRIKSEPTLCEDETVITNESFMKTANNSQKTVRTSDEILLSNQSVDSGSKSPLPKKRKLGMEMGVQEILHKSSTCQKLLVEYGKSGLLLPTQRADLVRSVVDFYIKNNLTISIDRCKEIAEEIVKLFPTECMETYFIEDKTTRSKGIIWQRYQGRKNSIRKIVALNLTQETLTNEPSTSDNDDTNLFTNTDWDNMQAICAQMKHINDENELFEKWKESFAFRRHQLQTGWFSNWKLYFDEYPFCKQQNYAQYIGFDLETLYPSLKLNDYLWNDFLDNFSTYFLNRIKHPKSKRLFDELLTMKNCNAFTDYISIKVFQLLHAVLRLYTNKMQSIEDAQRMFMVEVSDLSELKRTVIERKKYCTENNLPAKPYIAVVGQNKICSNFSVILDTTGFSCDSFKDSLVLCFNLYLFFDISFPHETLNVWTFIQKYFFSKPPLVKNARVDNFINEINENKTQINHISDK